MIRFRFAEDEKRYLSLVGEVYRLLASHLPAPAVQLAMRNLGKAQDMLLLEGVRQGVAVAEVSHLATQAGRSDARVLKAFQAHATVYGSADTPLRDMELEWLERLGLPAATGERAWLDGKPMRFAPQTYRAWQAEQATEASARGDVRARPPVGPALREEASFEDPPLDSLDIDEEIPPPAPGQDQEDTQERPALLDRVREVLQKLVKEGYQPGSWSEMIMRLHLVMQIDAGFLDLQMGTEMGRTVLAQCGVHDIFPGRGIHLEELKKTLDDPEAALSGGSTGT